MFHAPSAELVLSERIENGSKKNRLNNCELHAQSKIPFNHPIVIQHYFRTHLNILLNNPEHQNFCSTLLFNILVRIRVVDLPLLLGMVDGYSWAMGYDNSLVVLNQWLIPSLNLHLRQLLRSFSNI